MGDYESEEVRKWEKLVEEAKNLGLTIEYVRTFLVEKNKKMFLERERSQVK